MQKDSKKPQEMTMTKKKGKEKKLHGEDKDVTKDSGVILTIDSPTESETCVTFEDYQCTGNVQVDFPKLCTLLDITNIPAVHSSAAEDEGVESLGSSGCLSHQPPIQWSKPYLHVDLENKDRFSCKGLKIMGWKLDEQILQVLNKLVHNLSQLQSLYIWQAGLNDEILKSLKNTLSLGCNLRVVYLEGNPLPKHSYHLLLSEDSVITHLFLRNNQISDEGARLIGSALSTAKTANKTLLFLSLAFNHIGDAGAEYLAQGLRLNRTLTYLSLGNNQIGDSGAAHLSKILGKFPLTHEEVVERRKLLVNRLGLNFGPDLDPPEEGLTLLETNVLPLPKSEQRLNPKKKETSKKEEKSEKGPANKENLKKIPARTPSVKAGKAVVADKPALRIAPEEKPPQLLAEIYEEVWSPLLDPLVHRQDGQLFQPGNSTLLYLSLAGNAITKKSLPLFLSSLEQQTEGGLCRLCLNRNKFSPDCETFYKINQLLQLRNSDDKPLTEEFKDEEQS